MVFDSHEKNVSLCDDQCWADWLIVRRGKIFNVAIFWDTTDMLDAFQLNKCPQDYMYEIVFGF